VDFHTRPVPSETALANGPVRAAKQTKPEGNIANTGRTKQVKNALGIQQQLPPASQELGRATMPKGPRWGVDHCDRDEEAQADLDAAEVWHE